MAQQANLTLELDKVKDLLLCQGDTGVPKSCYYCSIASFEKN